MKELSIGFKLLIAIVLFLFFGWISITIGSYDWQEVLQTALLGVIAVFVVFNYK
ncbi:MAG: hypothetical protein K2L36_07385 [Eubacterium sp.]|nr:hypothetical protein [Eubacterium sp.]